MNRRSAMLYVLVLASLAAATYVASCSCGNPPAGDGRGATQPRRSLGEGGASAPVPLAQSRHALTSTVTTHPSQGYGGQADTDFLTPLRPSGFVGQAANRGYGVERGGRVAAGGRA